MLLGVHTCEAATPTGEKKKKPEHALPVSEVFLPVAWGLLNGASPCLYPAPAVPVGACHLGGCCGLSRGLGGVFLKHHVLWGKTSTQEPYRTTRIELYKLKM